MKLAWFRPEPLQQTDPLDDTAALIDELRSTHEVDVVTAADVEDFARTDARVAYDLSVCELDNTPAHAFIRPYALQRRGVLRLRTLLLHDNGPAVLASRVAVVSDPYTGEALQNEYPDARVKCARTGVQTVQEVRRAQERREGPVIVGVLSADRLDMIHRAVERAQQAGAAVELIADGSPARVLHQADVVVSLPWPWFGEPQTPALAAMAATKPVIVLETAGTADWPALDPQTWRPRGVNADAPIAVSIDPRDEEHSLVAAIRRLSSDAALRTRLGVAAHEWWRTHATPKHAAADWQRILAEAAALPAPAPRELAGSPEQRTHTSQG